MLHSFYTGIEKVLKPIALSSGTEECRHWKRGTRNS
jgi:hypothetical protein